MTPPHPDPLELAVRHVLELQGLSPNDTSAHAEQVKHAVREAAPLLTRAADEWVRQAMRVRDEAVADRNKPNVREDELSAELGRLRAAMTDAVRLIAGYDQKPDFVGAERVLREALAVSP